MFLKLKTFDDLIMLSNEKGWLSKLPIKTNINLPEIKVYSHNKFNLKKEYKKIESIVINQFSSEQLNINEKVIIVGSCLGLIFEGNIYPFGTYHSYNWIPSFDQIKKISEDEIYIKFRKTSLVNCLDIQYDMIGIVSHWGHFFVDTIDRIFCINNKSNLVFSDINFFKTFQNDIDKNYCVKQIGELLTFLSIDIDKNLKLILEKDKFYEFNKINMITLSSKKPSISEAIYQKIQDLVIKKNINDKGDLLYVGRNDVTKRRVINQDQVISLIKNIGGKAIFPENDNLTTSIKNFHSSSKIILIIGSTMFNLVFCKKGTHIVCIVPHNYSNEPMNSLAMLRHMCVALNLILDVYEVESSGSHVNLLNNDLILKDNDILNINQLFKKTQLI